MGIVFGIIISIEQTRMKHSIFIAFPVLLVSLLVACSKEADVPVFADSGSFIFPDYCGVTVPSNIAPLHFRLTDGGSKADEAVFRCGGIIVKVRQRHGEFRISAKAWKKLLAAAEGGSMEVKVADHEAFNIHVSSDEIDRYVSYRLIEPGYELWNSMGIYQRCLENFKESAIIKNSMTGGNCINCHSFCNRDQHRMLFHMRAIYPGTFMLLDRRLEKLNTKTDSTISALVYPSWHPSGKYVAFSANNTHQAFHTIDRNRIEVFDEASDVVVYDVEKHEIVTDPKLFSASAFETFPSFSPDGRTLYFCSADSTAIPENFDKVRYSLCAISFDARTRSFGEKVDTLLNAHSTDTSISFPRVSPDGRFLLCTRSGYGNFSIWHQDADLVMLDLESGCPVPVDVLNSDSVESYHSWSGNGRWVIFSSRRLDGLYTRLFISHVDADGIVSKPFLLPQKSTAFYDELMKSYNIPEFVSGRVRCNAASISRKARRDPGIDVVFR